MRQWLYELLSQDVEIAEHVENRVVQAGSYTTVPARPYLVFKLSSANPNTIRGTKTREIQLWVHDNKGGYSVIDEILDRLRVLLPGVDPVPVERLLEVTWIEDSQDFEDDTTDTAVKFARYQAVLSS